MPDTGTLDAVRIVLVGLEACGRLLQLSDGRPNAKG
jgi:hypothetical protein